MDRQTVVIPIKFPDPDPLPSTFIEGLTNCKVVLLGVYEFSGEIDPEERHRREIKAYQSLYTLAASFVRRGDTAEVELVIGEDVSDAPTTVAEEHDADALLIPNPITTLGHVLVAIHKEKFAEPIVELLSTLNQDVLLHLTLFHAAESDAETDAGEQLLSDVKHQLVDAGFSQASIDTEVVVSEDAPFAISQAARDDDLIVMGETQNPEFERVFGKTYESIAEESDLPVLVVRQH